MNSHRRPASVHVLELPSEIAGHRLAEWRPGELPVRTLRVLSEVVPFLPPDDPPPPAMAQLLAA